VSGVVRPLIPTLSFESVAVGTTLEGRWTITDAHIILAAGIFGDFAPLHVDEEFAKTTRFGRRIAHGTLVTGVMAGVLSKAFGEHALGYLEQNVRFVGPVFAGDTVATRWTVVNKEEKAKLGGGIVTLDVECTTQNGDAILTGRGVLVVGYGRAGDGAPDS
jgi:3-hydroxybutyryl-CoA dehydratase